MNQNLKLRVLTALAGVPVILALLTMMGIGGVAFLAWVVSMGMLFEYCRMCFHLEDARQKTFLALAVNTFIHAFNYVIPTGLGLSFITVVPTLLFFMVFLFMVPRLFHYRGKEFLETEQGVAVLRSHVQELMALCFGLVYCVVFPILMVGIREFVDGHHWLILTLIIIWASDSFAYFVGLRFGKHRLYETISPKKSWEGALGGALGAVALSLVYARFFLPRESAFFLIPVALVLSAVGIIGDLAESLLKRAFQMKDSGSILPGHGGFLDRFDGVVFALPVMYGILRFFG
jgi:phosphatidate cytidylyltransferase